MKHQLFSILIITGTLGLSVGCGNKSANDAKKQLDNNINAKSNPAIESASYITDCTTHPFSAFKLSLPGSQTSYDLSDLAFTKKQLYFTDACQAQSQAYVVQEKGTINSVANSGAVPNALEEDLKFEHTTITVTNELVLKAFNAFSACGHNDWVINVEKDVSSEADKCPGSLLPTNPPRVVPELVLRDNNNLYLGANGEQDPSKGRPAQIDRNLVFKKQ